MELGCRYCQRLLSVIMLIHFLIPQKTCPPSHSSCHSIFNPATRLLPSLAGTVPISAGGDTTCRESNTWEDSQFVRIVCAARKETFPALTTYVSKGFIILWVDTHDILSFLVPATKNEAHIGIQGQTTPVGSHWWNGINVCTRPVSVSTGGQEFGNVTRSDEWEF